jgi:hypothetical protein
VSIPFFRHLGISQDESYALVQLDAFLPLLSLHYDSNLK